MIDPKFLLLTGLLWNPANLEKVVHPVALAIFVKGKP